jgi:hypothetical protein
MRPVPVVVLDVDAESALQMRARADQHPVQALAAEGADPPLRERVCLRRLDRGADGLQALGLEHLVEGGAELGVSIVDHEREVLAAILQTHREAPRLLGRPRPIRIGGDTSEMHASARELDEGQDVQASEEHCIDREEVAGKQTTSPPCAGAQDRSRTPSGSPTPSTEPPRHRGVEALP